MRTHTKDCEFISSRGLTWLLAVTANIYPPEPDTGCMDEEVIITLICFQRGKMKPLNATELKNIPARAYRQFEREILADL